MHASASVSWRHAIGICLGILLFAGACGPADPETAEAPSPLVGTWVRFYLWTDLKDTLHLMADGSASGSVSDAVGPVLPPHNSLKSWQIGHSSMPGGLCLSDDNVIQCQGFLLKGDTLALAIAPPVVFVRVDASASGDSAATPRPPPAGTTPFQAHAPRMGEEVHGIPPAPDR